MSITYGDISKRAKNRYNKYTDNSININPIIYVNEFTFCRNNAENSIRNWESLDIDSNRAYDKALDIYIELCLNSSETVIKENMYILAEAINKVRNATQLSNSLKYRKSLLQNKIKNKLNKKYTPISTAIANSINSINSSLSSKLPATTKVAKESFDYLIDKAEMISECDRVIDNYNKISKRFNIDKIISEMTTYDDIHFSILNIAACIDTYNFSFKEKFSHTLEASYYALNKNNINYPNEKIVESVLDYFIFSNGLNESNIADIKRVRDISVLYEESDFDLVDYIYNDDEEKDIEDEVFDINGDGEVDINDLIESSIVFNEGDISKAIKNKKKEIKKAARQIKKDAKKGNPEERVDRLVKKDLDKFRKQCIKDPSNKNNVSRLKSLVNTLFTKNPEQIVEELPGLFNIITTIAFISTAYINPILGLVSFITSQIIRMSLTRKQTGKIVSAYQKEIDKVKDKLSKAKDDNSKDHLEKYLKELEKDYAKIKEYENNLYSDEENYDRDTSTTYTNYANSDDDDDWDVDMDIEWDDFDFEEAASIIYISDIVSSINEGLIDDNVDGIILGNIYKLDNDSIDALTDFSITVPVILEKNKLLSTLESYREELRNKSNPNVDDYIRIDCINENIHKINTNANVYATTNNLSGIRCYLACINEMVNMNNSEEYIMEMNFSNTLKLAVDRLKKSAVKLSDKDKQISNTIDVSVNNISKGIETALMNDNREAVIKGRILPSASKCIKLACVVGALWIINPAISVITAIGGFACSQKLKAKERQLVLDDIEIELKMVDRYIRQAEDNNDLKKLRQLEMIKRNLTRQQQRIKYKMHVIYKQDVPNTASEYDD